jgi:hypothetical protein
MKNFASPQIFSTRPGDFDMPQNTCPFAESDMGCTALTDPMSCEDLQPEHLDTQHQLLQPDPDQTILLRPPLQPFVTNMPSDSAPLRNRCDSGFEEDSELYYICDEGQDGDSQWSMQQLLQQESFCQFSGEDTEPLQSESLDLHEQTIESLFAQMEAQSAARLVDSPCFRFVSAESGKCSGYLIWKIDLYSEHKAVATSMLSTPFYSGRYGYKMCLRLYIMGDGIGKGTHLSLFFVVMRGEFDTILQWPFTHKVTFKLINQAGGRDIVDTFKPRVMKPSQDNNMNNASGCPCFITHSELEQGGFVADDMLFIKCTIDTSTINHP